MRLSHTDLLPVMAIIGGGAVGVLTFSPLALWSTSDDMLPPVIDVPSVPVPDLSAEPTITPFIVSPFTPFTAARRS